MPFHVAHLTDFHLFGDTQACLVGINTTDSFEAVHALALKRHSDTPFDLVLLTGDFSQDETETSYQHCVRYINAFNCDKIAVPGNHDHSQRYEKYFSNAGIKTDFYIQKDNWLCVMIPTKIEGAIEGHVAQHYFDTLRTLLETFPRHHVLIATHHHLYPIEADWLQRYTTQNADEFRYFLKQFPQIKLVLSGHVHHEGSYQDAHIHYYTTPSTCLQFDEKQKNFALTALCPGYRTVLLYPNGQFETRTHRVKTPFLPEAGTKGY